MTIERLTLGLVILIFSAILHEIAHGFVAERLGDPTARLLGRLTLNPKSHIDPMMTIIFPLITLFSSSALGIPLVFGGAKPVPVDPFNLREPKKDMALISIAGPGTNLLIAIFVSLLIHLIFPNASLFSLLNGLAGIFGLFLGLIVSINLSLAIFNLLPIPPLDGSKVFALLLPDDLARSYLSIGSYGMFILFFLLLFPLGPISLGNIISNIMNTFLTILGLA